MIVRPTFYGSIMAAMTVVLKACRLNHESCAWWGMGKLGVFKGLARLLLRGIGNLIFPVSCPKAAKILPPLPSNDIDWKPIRFSLQYQFHAVVLYLGNINQRSTFGRFFGHTMEIS